MKISIFLIAISALMWACNSKHEKTAEEVAAAEDSVKNAEAAAKERAAAERKAKLKEVRDAKEQQIRTAWEEKSKTARTYKDAKGNVVYYKGEVDPSFTGGRDAMMKYLRENLKYPESALNNRDEGTVWVDFVVDKKGKVKDVSAKESTWSQPDSTLVSEAVRVVSAMPAWQPGTQGKKPVDVAYTIPITFELDY